MTHHPHHRLGERNLRIGVKIWLFFMLFVCVVFLLMWLFQVIFLEWFYESMKIRDTAKLAQQLVSDYGSDDFSQDAQEISLQNEMCIELLNTNGREVYYNCVYNGKCLLHGEGNGTFFYLIDLQNSSTGTICRKVSNPNLQNQMLVYGCTMYSKDDGSVLGYLLLNSPLVPVESTVSILKRQTMMITIMLVFFGFLILGIALFVYFSESKKVTRKIRQKRANIEYELPRLVGHIEKLLTHSRDIIYILESYIPIARPELKEELFITVAEMRSSGNIRNALDSLDKRIGSAWLSEVVRALETVENSADTTALWTSLSMKFKELQRLNLKAQANTVPRKVKKLSMALMMCFLLIYIAVIGQVLMNSLGGIM